MEKEHMKVLIRDYLSDPRISASDQAARLNQDIAQQQNEHQQAVAAATASAGRYEGSPPPSQIRGFGPKRSWGSSSNLTNEQTALQVRDDLLSAFRGVLLGFPDGQNFNADNINRLFHLFYELKFSGHEMLDVTGPENPIAPSRGVNPIGAPIQQIEAVYHSGTFARAVTKIFDEYADPSKQINDQDRDANIAIVAQVTEAVAQAGNPGHKLYVNILSNLLNSGKVESARLMLKMVEDHASQHLNEICSHFVGNDEGLSSLIKSTQNVVLIADLIKNFVPQESRDADFQTMLTNSDFYGHIDTPKKLLSQSNPASLAHFIEISGGVNNQNNQNLLGSIAHFLQQPENAELRSSEACQNSLIWLVEKFPEKKGDFEGFLSNDNLRQLKEGQIKKLMKLFDDQAIAPEFRKLGYDPQIEAGKFFTFLHSEEFQKQWANLSNSFQVSYNSTDPTGLPKIRNDNDKGATLSQFEGFSSDLLRLTFSKAIEYEMGNSLFSKEKKIKLSGEILKLAERDNILPNKLIIPEVRRPSSAAAASDASQFTVLESQRT